MRNVSLVVLASAGLLLTQCKKKEDKPSDPESCRGSYQVLDPSGYNSDSVFIYFPTVFTPNGDGINDLFSLVGEGVTQRTLQVHKNNEPVFQSSSGQSWDGMHNGKPGDGVYSFSAGLITRHNDTVLVVGSVEVYGSGSTTTFQHCNKCVFADQIEPDKGIIMNTQESLNFCD